jgi:hypothetical protein
MAYLIGGYSLSLISFGVKIFIGFLWALSFTCAALPILGVNEYVVYRNPLFCGPNLDYSTWQVIAMTSKKIIIALCREKLLIN